MLNWLLRKICYPDKMRARDKKKKSGKRQIWLIVQEVS